MSIRFKAFAMLLLVLPVLLGAIALLGGAAILLVHAHDRQQDVAGRALVWIIGLMLAVTTLRLAARLGDRTLGWLVGPRRVRVTRAMAPALWQHVDAWATRVGAPQVDRLDVTAGITAGASSRRAWLFGPRRYRLRIGLPVFRLLRAEELDSVLAHELAHLRHADACDGTVVSVTQALLLLIGDPCRSTPGWIRNTFQRLGDRLRLETLAASREAERAADAAATAFCGAETCARTLVRLMLASKRITCRSMDVFEAPLGTISGPSDWATLEAQAGTADPRDAGWVRALLARPTSPLDSHPCLHERLTAIGVDVEALTVPDEVPPADAAAERWLRDLLPTLERRLTVAHEMAEAATPEPPTSRSPEETRSLLGMLMLSPHTATPLLTYDLAAELGDEVLMRRILDDALLKPSSRDVPLSWIVQKSLSLSTPPDLERAARTLDRMETVDPLMFGMQLEELAERLAIAGRMEAARAAFRLADRVSARRTSRWVPSESTLRSSDLSVAALTCDDRDRIGEALDAHGAGAQAWIVRSHASLDLLRPRLVLAIDAAHRWWHATERLRAMQARLDAMGEIRVEVIRLDRCTPEIQNRIRAMQGAAMTDPDGRRFSA